MRVLIVDDEAPARAKLRRLLSAESDILVVGEAASGDEAITSIEGLRPDLVLLDVRMPGGDGFSVVSAISRESMPRIVFITAHSEHALRAFDVRAIDYLMKPVSPARFAEMLQRVRESLATGSIQSGLTEQLHQLARAMARGPTFLERILVRSDTKAVFVAVDRVDWIEAERNYVHLHVGPTVYLERSSIGELAASLDPARFLRINRSQIVRLDAVRELHPWSHGDFRVILRDGTSLSWSRRYRAATAPDFRPGKR